MIWNSSSEPLNILEMLFCIMCVCSVVKSYPTLCDPMDCSLPGSSVYGISQARILEWVAISSSRESSQSRAELMSPALAGGFFTTKPCGYNSSLIMFYVIHVIDNEEKHRIPTAPSKPEWFLFYLFCWYFHLRLLLNKWRI